MDCELLFFAVSLSYDKNDLRGGLGIEFLFGGKEMVGSVDGDGVLNSIFLVLGGGRGSLKCCGYISGYGGLFGVWRGEWRGRTAFCGLIFGDFNIREVSRSGNVIGFVGLCLSVL